MYRRQAPFYDLGQKLKQARLQRGLSQREVAETTGMSLRQVAHVEAGENVSLSYVEQLVDLLSVRELPLGRARVRIRHEDAKRLRTLMEEAAKAAGNVAEVLRSAKFKEIEDGDEELTLAEVDQSVRPKVSPFSTYGLDEIVARQHAIADLPFEPVGVGGEVVDFPIRGYVAAGRPIDAETHDETVSLPKEFVGDNEYILRARGDSMIEWGIQSGDLLIVERRAIAATGELVIAWYNDGVTVKQWFYKRGKRMLVAGNPDAESYELKDGDVVEILGVVTNIVKSTRGIIGSKRVPLGRVPRLGRKKT